MAYNPFDFFRKNQKILFAGLTILVMFMFVLSFGRGDFFDWLPRWLGSKRSTGEVMAVIDGDKIRASELDRLRTQRTIANKFMVQAAFMTYPKIFTNIQQSKDKVSLANQQTVDSWMENTEKIRTARDPQEQRMAQTMLRRIQPSIESMAFKEASPPEDREVAQSILRLTALERRLNDGRGELFFLNQPNRTSRDELEFILWQKKADALGIKFRESDLEDLIREELPRLTKADQEKILDEMAKSRRGLNAGSLNDALIEEFRVLTAQQAVLGRTGRGFTSPYDLYSFYKTETTPHQYGFVSIPVDNFIPFVKGQPTETELREIFKNTKSTEPDPSSPRPGIKEPRRLKIQWLEATGNEPFYQAAGLDWVKKSDWLRRLSGGFLQPLTGTSTPVGIAITAATINLDDPLYAKAYEDYNKKHNDAVGSWYVSGFDLLTLDTSFVRPQTIVSLIGLSGAAAALASGPLPIPMRTPLVVTSIEKQVAIHNKQTRIRAALPFLATPLLPNISEVLASAASHKLALPQPLPIEALKAVIASDVAKKLQYDVCRADLNKFQEDLKKVTEGKKEKAAEAKAKIDEFVKTRGVKLGQSETFDDIYTIEADPGLKPLFERKRPPQFGQDKDEKIGRQFFMTKGFKHPQTGQVLLPEKETKGFFSPQPFPPPAFSFGDEATPVTSPSREDDPQFLAWRMDEQPARQPADFEAGKAKCEQIWRLQKARELAKAAADEFAEKIRGKDLQEIYQAKVEFEQRFDDAGKAKVKFFERIAVAPIVIDAELGSPTMQARPFVFAPGEDIPYPTDKLRNDLLALNNKPLYSTAVLYDNPEAIYYVASLLKAEATPVGLFRMQLFPTQGSFNGPDSQIKGAFEAKTRMANRADAIALLKAEFDYKDENPKVNDKVDTSGE